MLSSSKLLTQLDPFFGRPSDAGPRSSGLEHSVGVDELAALRDVDLALPPELAEPSGRALSDFGQGDRLRLGPPPSAPAEAERVNAAIGRMLETYEQGRGQATSRSADDAVKEAKMIAVLDQIHRLRLDIASKSRRPA